MYIKHIGTFWYASIEELYSGLLGNVVDGEPATNIDSTACVRWVVFCSML